MRCSEWRRCSGSWEHGSQSGTRLCPARCHWRGEMSKEPDETRADPCVLRGKRACEDCSQREGAEGEQPRGRARGSGPSKRTLQTGAPKLGRARKIRKHGGVRGDWRGWIFKHNSTSLEVFSRRAGFKARGPASSKRIIGRAAGSCKPLQTSGERRPVVAGWYGADGAGWRRLRFATCDMS